MENYDVQVPKRPQKQIRAIPLPWRDRIKRAIDFLEYQPYAGEKMEGGFRGQRKLKVWPYRIFYRIDKAERKVIILKVKHRGSAGY